MSDPPVLLVGLDAMGRRLAGPGMRLRAMARHLARRRPVQVWSRPPFDWEAEARSEGWSWRSLEQRALIAAVGEARAVVAAPGLLGRRVLFHALRRSVPLIFDCYVPAPVEAPWYFAALGGEAGREGLRKQRIALDESLEAGDLFLFAGRRQRAFWRGELEGRGRVDADRLLLSCPFGLEADRRPRVGTWLDDVLPGLPAGRPLVVWGGGLWDWLDGESLVDAVHACRHDERPPVLVFPGTRHPDAAVPPMGALERCRERARRSGALDRTVFFLDGWASLEGREDVLARAAVGATLSRSPEEAAVAFRTRVLDYLWAGLPVLCTEGDELADHVAADGWGRTVPIGAPEAVRDALRELLRPEVASACRQAMDRVREDWDWGRVLAGLDGWLASPVLAGDRPGPLVWAGRRFLRG